MNQIAALGTAIGLSIFLSAVIWAALIKPLRGVLSQLCPDSAATRFWLTFTSVMMFAAPLLCTLLFEAAVLVPTFASIVRSALASSLFGSCAALLVVGHQISQARPRGRDGRVA